MANQATVTQKEWRKLPIKDLVDLVVDNRGRNPDHYVLTGIPVIDNVLIKGERKIELDDARRFIDDDTYSTFIRKYNQEKDVLITLVGNGYGNVALSPKEKSTIMQNTIGLRCNDLGDNVFLFYNLSLNKRSLTDLNIGAAQPSIKVGDLLSIELTIPPITEQRAIAAVLSSLDDKIELLRVQNKTLEATAQAVFKEWFVNFNFPDTTGKMIDSELGQIPEGWRAYRFDEIMNFTQGIYIPKEEYEIDGINTIYGSNSIMGKTDKKSHDGAVIVLAKIGSYCGAIRYSERDCWINNNAGGIKGVDISTAFIYELLKCFNFGVVREGSGQPYINMQGLKSQKFALPQMRSELFNNTTGAFDSFYKKIGNNEVQIQTLSTLRDTLLPKLMKGEVRVEGFKN